MTTLVIALVLAAALAHAAWNAMLKGRKGEPLPITAGLCLAWLAFGLPLMFFVEPPAPAAWPYLAVSIVVHLVYTWLLVVAYRVADLSLVYPIARGTPPLVVAVIGWVLLREQPSAWGIAGVALVALGVLGLGFVRTRGAKKGAREHWRGVGVALLVAAFISTYLMLDGVGVRASRSPLGYAVWLTTIQGGLFGFGALAFGGAEVRAEIWRRRRDGAIAGVLAAGGYGIALWAMDQAPLAFVTALRETSVVFAAVIGALFLKESFGRRRILAALVVAAGVIAIQSSS